MVKIYRYCWEENLGYLCVLYFAGRYVMLTHVPDWPKARVRASAWQGHGVHQGLSFFWACAALALASGLALPEALAEWARTCLQNNLQTYLENADGQSSSKFRKVWDGEEDKWQICNPPLHIPCYENATEEPKCVDLCWERRQRCTAKGV